MNEEIFEKFGDEPSIEDAISLKTQKDWTGNKRSTYATLGASNQADHERETNDYYATDPDAINRLLSIVQIDNSKKVWEPCCGEGNLSKRLEEFGYEVVSTDLIDRGFGTGGVDFLKFPNSNCFDGTILTNPPYKMALEMCKKALDVVTAGNRVYMFLRIQFLETSTRADWFKSGKSGLKTVYVFGKRIGCWMNNKNTGASSAQAYCWFEFEKGYVGDAILKWI